MAMELIQRDIGKKTRVVEKTVDVGTTPIQILENNPNRLMLVIQNIGGNTAFIGLTKDVSTTSGLMLAANGGLISAIWKEDGELVVREMYAIATASTKLYILMLVID